MALMTPRVHWKQAETSVRKKSKCEAMEPFHPQGIVMKV